MSIISKETIEVIAQSIGITNLSPDVTLALALGLALALAVEYSLREIMQESIKCMRYSKRTVLTADDVDSALSLKNVEPIYGFASGDPLRFKRAVGHKDIFYIDDRNVDFKEVIEEPLTKALLDTAVVAHWLAIEGMQPAIPENAPVEGKSNNDGVGVVTRIPEDILHYAILPWLPYKTLAKLKIVCRKWHHLISYDPLFAHEQSRRGSPTFSGFVYVGDKEDCIKFLSIDDAPAAVSSFSSSLPTTYVADIIACANGLLLLIHNGVERSYYLWNPARNQGHFVPESGRGYGFLHVGLAFDPSATPRCRLVNLMLECQGEGMVQCSLEIFSSDREVGAFRSKSRHQTRWLHQSKRCSVRGWRLALEFDSIYSAV